MLELTVSLFAVNIKAYVSVSDCATGECGVEVLTSIIQRYVRFNVMASDTYMFSGKKYVTTDAHI